MATYTNYYNLEKPSLNEIVDVNVINDNYDTIDEAINNAQSLALNIGTAYNPIIAYQVDDYCIYNNNLYKCVQATSSGDTFNPAKWQICKVTDDLGGTDVVANPSGSATSTLTKIEVDGTIYGISGGGGGSTVIVTPTLQSGTKVADIDVDGNTSSLYAPTPTDVEANPSSTGTTNLTKLKVGSTTYNVPQGGGSTVSVNQTLSSGTEVGGIVVDNVETKLYAPTPTTVVANPSGTPSTDLEKITIGSTDYNIPVGSIVVANPTGTSGSNLTRIKIDGTDYNIPSGGSGSSTLAGLSDVDLTSLSNGQILKYDGQYWVNANESGTDDIVHLTQAQYDALPSSKLTDDKVYMITDVNGDGSQFQPVIYSEDEREIGVWTDGKPLYQKTIKITQQLTVGQDNFINHGISDIDKCISIKGFCTYNQQDEILPMPYVSKNPTSYSIVLGNVTDTTFLIALGDTFSSVENAIVTFQYTKTTDMAGSGTWTPQGVPAVHYSTDEQVIGTWIDGSTLYQKTIEIDNFGNATTTNVAHNINNLGYVVDISGSMVSSNSSIYDQVGLFNGNSDGIRIQVNSTNILIKAMDDWSDRSGYITIQYTKTQGGN